MSENRRMRSKPEDKIATPLGRRLYRLRYEANIPQRTVAEYLNTSRAAYSYYELGTIEPNLNILKKLSKFYDIPLLELIQDT